MFIHVVTMATLYYMLSTLFYVNFSFYGLNSNKGYKSVRKPSHLPISPLTKWSRQATLQIVRGQRSARTLGMVILVDRKVGNVQLGENSCTTYRIDHLQHTAESV